MKAKIVKIGNSQGVRIPKILLNESLLDEDVELEVCDEGILIRPAKNPRQNWDKYFREMAEDDADEMLIEDGDAQGSFEKGGVAMVNRFGIYLLNLDEEITDDPKNSRPCVVVSPDEMNSNIESVIIAPVSSDVRKYPTRISFEFLEKKRAIVLDQLRTVDKLRLFKKIGDLGTEARERTVAVLQEMFAE